MPDVYATARGPLARIASPAAARARARRHARFFALTGLREGARVLDVATGTGLVAEELLRTQDVSVVGLDQSPEMLAAAQEADAVFGELGRPRAAADRLDGLDRSARHVFSPMPPAYHSSGRGER